MKTTGNTILITGGTSGIGLALGLKLRELGNEVIVAGRREGLLEDIASKYPGIGTAVLDIADPESVSRAMRSVLTQYPQLNVLINNAGIMQPESLRNQADVTIAEATIATNLLGTVRMTYAFLPHLISVDNAAILNVSSALAFVPWPNTPTYSATKAALHSFSDSLRVQVAHDGVQVIEIAPPGVQTGLMGQENSPHAMPLDDFITETIDLLTANPDTLEIVPAKTRPMRDAAANGNYREVLTMLSGV